MQREDEKNSLFALNLRLLKNVENMVRSKRHADGRSGQTLRGRAIVHSIPEAPSMPALTNPSTFTVSAWHRKTGGHPRGRLAVFVDMRRAATLSIHLEMCSLPSRKK